jgi:hypothetical protein
MLRWSGALIGRAEERTSLLFFDEKLQENETLERYYTTIHLAVYSAVEGDRTAFALSPNSEQCWILWSVLAP